MTNVQGDKTPARRQKLLKKFENIHEDRRRTMHEFADTVWISYGVRQILREHLNMRRIAPSSQRARPHVPEQQRVCDQQHGYHSQFSLIAGLSPL
jgi:hypothetical protein